MTTNGEFGYLSLLDLGKVGKIVNPLKVYGCNCFIPKKLIYEFNGFHPDGFPSDLIRFRGDGEMGLMEKFSKAGLIAYYDPNATAYHIINKDRMTVEYLCKRAYNEGISRSFKEIRSEYYENAQTLRKSDWQYYFRRVQKMTLTDFVMSINKHFQQLINKISSSDFSRIQKQLENSEHEGWIFHQMTVGSDTDLLRYVLKENYLD